MHPLTVMVLALVVPGPPAVDEELETLPPPACTCTDDPPAELELDSEPLDAVDPVVPVAVPLVGPEAPPDVLSGLEV